MTNEEKRITILEACGLNLAVGWARNCWLGETTDKKTARKFKGVIVVKDDDRRPTGLYRMPVPDYLRSLDAIHDAEKHLGLHDKANSHLRVAWANAMRDIVGHPASDVDIATATAEQRADGILAIIKA